MPPIRQLITALAAAAVLAPATDGAASAAPPIGEGTGGVRLTQIGSFDFPVHVEDAPGKKNRKLLFVVEKEGRVIALRNGVRLPQPFLDISDLVLAPDATEQGLLSIAFHPRYEKNRRFYVYFTNKAGDNEVDEFRRKRKSPFGALRGTRRPLLVIPHPDNASNHNGGQLQFGPDKLLYLAPGDGGSTPLAAQDANDLNGKLLRINPTPRKKRKRKGKGRRSASAAARAPYGIPPGNPFAAGPGRDEIYSLGLRNPFRFSFDAASGAIVLADVGASAREEVDFRDKGAARGVNFGWPRFEGTLLHDPAVSAPGAVGPIHEYATHVGGTCTIIGGFVVRDERLLTQYARYLYIDLCLGQLRSLIPSQFGAADDQAVGVPTVDQPVSFGEGRGRQLFLATLPGAVYRLDP